MGLAPTIFCLVLIAMGAMTLTTELLSLICAALVLIVSVILLCSWAVSCMISNRWRKATFGVCGALIGVDVIFGFATWIILIIDRRSISDPLASSSVILARERIIAAGFACWAFLLITQVSPIGLQELISRLHLSSFLPYGRRNRPSTLALKSVLQHYPPPH